VRRLANTSVPEPVSDVQQRPVTVFCADDQAVFRNAVREIIAATPGLSLVGEAASGEEAIIAAAALRPDLILIDVHMPGIGGNEAARTLVERHRNVIVVLMSADLIDRPPRFAPGNGEIVIVAKEELSPRTLLDLWHERRTR
jgi:CheY-like chemotaxis protein